MLFQIDGWLQIILSIATVIMYISVFIKIRITSPLTLKSTDITIMIQALPLFFINIVSVHLMSDRCHFVSDIPQEMRLFISSED